MSPTDLVSRMVRMMLLALACVVLIIREPRSLVVSADDRFREGFVSDVKLLPGGENDLQNITGVSYGTSINRYADGVTTTAAYEVTSPHFPVYRGASANNSERYKSYTRYVESAAEQGLALFGDGDQVREAARLRITSLPDFETLPAPSKTFKVFSAIKWNPSDYAIQEGETYNITVFGSQTGRSDQFWFDGGLRVNAQGYSSYFDAISNCYVGMGRCRPHLKKRRRLQDANWMSLACAIGQFVRPLTEVEPGEESTFRWMPLDESTLEETIFDVGLSVVFRADYTGQLICFANDAHTLYWNNQGDIDVTVTRVSWPPVAGSVYEASLLPACDSAQVVFKNLQAGAEVTPCNPDGGGSGWSQEDIQNTEGNYGSGAPRSIFADLP